MLAGQDAFFTVLSRVRDDVALALANTPGGKPARVAVMPGMIAWDDCDTCGLLALSLLRTYLSDEFPIESAAPASVANTQGALLCADMTLQIIRCAPTPQGAELAPEIDALENTARIINADAYATLCTTLTTLGSLAQSDDILDYLVRPQNMVGPDGACVGSEFNFTVSVIR